MKKKSDTIRLQIPQPCGEDFSAMHPLPGGHFCVKCERTIIDFRGMSDGELVRLYQQRQGRICGIFRNDQLDRKLRIPASPESKNWPAIAAFASALMLGTAAGAQQAVAPPFQPEIVSPSEIKTPETHPGKLTITGQVLDEKDEPLPFAFVVLNGTIRGTETELDGYFSIDVPAGITEQELTVSFLGYASQTVLWTKETEVLEVRMKVGIDLPLVTVSAFQNLRQVGKLTGYVVSLQKDGDQEIPEMFPTSTNTPLLSIFPNPFVSTVFIEIETPTPDTYLFHLYSAAGQLVFAESRELPEGQQTLELDLVQRELPEGIYFLRISDGIGEVRTKQIVKVTP